MKRQRDVEDIEAAEPPAGSEAKAVSPWQGVSAQRTGVKTPIGWPKCFLVIPLLHKKRDPSGLFFVELGGLEPPSKRRIRQLSTRLVLLGFSSAGCRKTGHPKLIP